MREICPAGTLAQTVNPPWKQHYKLTLIQMYVCRILPFFVQLRACI